MGTPPRPAHRAEDARLESSLFAPVLDNLSEVNIRLPAPCGLRAQVIPGPSSPATARAVVTFSGVQQDWDAGVTFRIGLLGAVLPLLFGCAGLVDEVSTIPAEEAAWQALMPRLAGMPAAEVERCAGPPRGVIPAPGGRVLSFAADYAAPEFLGLRDGSNYCGRIFQSCLR